VVVKHVADAFQQTDLAKHLEGVEELLVCGMMTQNCVAFSAMSRDADNYRVSVVGDLCAAPSEIVHKIALNALGSKRTLYSAAELWP
jgi:nicotinamidase-related amidase